MQIILLDKVVNLGNLGEIVKVKDGYARNFLIPSGRARRATESAIKEFEARRAELEKVAAEKLAAAQAQGEKLGGTAIKLSAARFKLFDRAFCGTTSTARWDQEVAGVAIFHLDDFAEVAEVHDLVEQNNLHGRFSLDFVLVAVRQHGKEARTLDGRVELTLVNGAGAGQACRDDFSVFGNEVTQGVDIFVIDLFDTGHGETAKALALEQQRLGIALGALVFVEFLERSHDLGFL